MLRIEIHTWCHICGPNVTVDEDGCCSTCGAEASGPWIKAIDDMFALLDSMTEEDRAREIIAQIKAGEYHKS